MCAFKTGRGWRTLALLIVLPGLLATGAAARADALYSITDLGTLPGQSSSVATGINNLGQVVGISYNSSDGSFNDTLSGSPEPPRFWQAGDGARSFLYSSGQMAQISPTGGLAMSINGSGQVVGGSYSSINDAGQYVGGAGSGIQNGNPIPDQLVSGGSTTILSYFAPYAINNAGQIVGTTYPVSGSAYYPAIYQNGQITDLSSKLGIVTYNGRAIAINQKGDILVSAVVNGTPQSYLLQSSTGQVTNLTGLSGSNLVASALNDKEQVVGNGFLYDDGTFRLLTSLIPAASGWSDLNATGINDAGQIVGQGLINGQEQAFLMTPEAATPEPGAVAIWALLAAGGCALLRRRAAPLA